MTGALAAWRGIAAAVCCLALLAGCAHTAPALPMAATGPYRLDTGDTVRVIVYNQESLSTEYTVSDDGTISGPMVGAVPARGHTVPELQADLYDKLNSGVLVKPGVSVQLSQARPIFVTGEVSKPGQYPFQSRLSVLGAVAAAGGFTVRANREAITVVRSADGHSAEWTAGQLDNLQPGDVVVVREQFF